MSALSIQGVSKSYGRTKILRDVTLAIPASERHAIIGPNGAGKSTLFHVVSGLTSPTSGAVLLHGQPIGGLAPHLVARRGLSRSFQITNLFPRLSVFENVRCALLQARGYGLSFLHLLGRAKGLNAEAGELLESIGLANRRDVPAGGLSYAEQRALEIGVAVAGDARVVLLDEPTAGMSRTETEATVALIRRMTEGRTLVMVEHDMAVVFELAERVSVLVDGGILATGTPEAIRADPRVQEAYLGAAPELAQ
ncbi:MAG: ABC transporter ATP-binding protein [Pseudomonadota bacterium]